MQQTWGIARVPSETGRVPLDYESLGQKSKKNSSSPIVELIKFKSVATVCQLYVERRPPLRWYQT
jgi:hypothetical protein